MRLLSPSDRRHPKASTGRADTASQRACSLGLANPNSIPQLWVRSIALHDGSIILVRSYGHYMTQEQSDHDNLKPHLVDSTRFNYTRYYSMNLGKLVCYRPAAKPEYLVIAGAIRHAYAGRIELQHGAREYHESETLEGHMATLDSSVYIYLDQAMLSKVLIT